MCSSDIDQNRLSAVRTFSLLEVNGVVQYLKVEHLICFEMIRALAGFVS
jgi:hypothetical protein